MTKPKDDQRLGTEVPRGLTGIGSHIEHIQHTVLCCDDNIFRGKIGFNE